MDKETKGKAPPPAVTGKVSEAKLRTPAHDVMKNSVMVTATAPHAYNPNEHAPPVCMGGFSDFPGRRPRLRPELVLIGGVIVLDF